MRKTNLNIILFLIALLAMGSLSFVKWDKKTVSELENRNLHSKPVFTWTSLFSGSYFKEYEDYYSDNFAFRDRLVVISSGINQARGFHNKDGASIIQHNGENIAEAQKAPEPEDSSEQKNGSLKAEIDGAERNRKFELSDGNGTVSSNGKGNETPIPNKGSPHITPDAQKESDTGRVQGEMLVLNDAAMEIYHSDKDSISLYAGMINKFKEKVDEQVKVYSLLIPTQIEFIKNEKYKKISDSQKEAIQYINQQFNKDIVNVDAYDILSCNTDKYIYFRTDHHWTALGAYYAYTAFANAIGQSPVPIEKYETDKIEGFLGSTYSATLNKKLQSRPDTIFLYKPFVKHEYYIYYEGALKMPLLDMSHADKQRKYRVFLSGDRPLGKIVTEEGKGRKIMIVKDSYANAFVPFLLPHYSEIYIVDPRQYKQNIVKLTREKHIDDVLFINYVPAANIKEYSQMINDCI